MWSHARKRDAEQLACSLKQLTDRLRSTASPKKTTKKGALLTFLPPARGTCPSCHQPSCCCNARYKTQCCSGRLAAPSLRDVCVQRLKRQSRRHRCRWCPGCRGDSPNRPAFARDDVIGGAHVSRSREQQAAAPRGHGRDALLRPRPRPRFQGAEGKAKQPTRACARADFRRKGLPCFENDYTGPNEHNKMVPTQWYFWYNPVAKSGDAGGVLQP